MKTAIYPGSFDPLTNGHMDIIDRASKIFDKLIVLVANNSHKSPMFLPEIRKKMIEKSTSKYNNIEVFCYDGLLVDFAKTIDKSVIIKGVRSSLDFEREFQMAFINRELDKSIETFLMVTSPKVQYISSSLVKEIYNYNGNISQMVPKAVYDKIILNNREEEGIAE